MTCFIKKKTCESPARKNNPEQMQAKDVKGCTEMRQDPWAAQGWAGPVEGTGAHTGKVKNFGTKGYGFITMEVWRCNDEMCSSSICFEFMGVLLAFQP